MMFPSVCSKLHVSQLAGRHKESPGGVPLGIQSCPGCFISIGMLRACMGISVRMRANPLYAGHQSVGLFGWNVTQETHNGDLMCVLSR